MRAPAEIRKLIESRLKSYVSRDRTGIRREMLRLFIRIKSLTIQEIYEALNKRFSISYHSVAAMVGIIASRIGILRVSRSRDGAISVYELKDKYHEIVVHAVGA
jgi:hypothetical protein